MAIRTWQGDVTSVAHVWAGEINTYAENNTFTITLTDENNKTHAFTHTVAAGVASTAVVATNFVSEWNASTTTEIRALTASVDGTTTDKVVLTGEAGIPYTIADSVGGSAAWANEGDVTTGTGPNDWTNPANWLEGAIPVDNDEVHIPSGSSSILYNLDGLTNIDCNEFHVHPGYTGNIGGTAGQYLHVMMDASKAPMFAGTGTAYIYFRGEAGSSNTVNLSVYNTATPSEGNHGLYLMGEQYENIYVYRGYVGCGIVPQNGNFEAATIHVGYVDDPVGDATVTIGRGNYALDGSSGVIIKQYAGTVVNQSSAGVCVIKGGRYIQDKYGTWANGTEISGDAIVELNAPHNVPGASTKIGTFTLDDTAQLLNETDPSTKAMAGKIVGKADGVTIKDPNGLISWNTDSGVDSGISLDFAGCNMSQTVLDIGRNKQIIISDS